MRAADDEQVQQQQQQQAQQPELLADDREDEVGGALGQELELRLAAVHPALAEHAAGADGDLRLDDVVAGAERIGLRVEEGEDALALVVVHEAPAEPGGQRRRAAAAPTMTRTRSPASTMTSTPAAGDQGGGAEVRLRGHQPDRQQDHRREQRPASPQPGGSGRSCRYQAHIIGTASFMISEGWKRTGRGRASAGRRCRCGRSPRRSGAARSRRRTARARAAQEIGVDARQQQHGDRARCTRRATVRSTVGRLWPEALYSTTRP